MIKVVYISMSLTPRQSAESACRTKLDTGLHGQGWQYTVCMSSASLESDKRSYPTFFFGKSYEDKTKDSNDCMAKYSDFFDGKSTENMSDAQLEARNVRAKEWMACSDKALAD